MPEQRLAGLQRHSGTPQPPPEGEDNDPHGEHDFGAFSHNGRTIFWKIDYYDRTLSRGSVDPADTSNACRVLTIMLAEEW